LVSAKMRAVATVAGRTVCVELSVVADRTGLDPVVLAELLAPVVGVRVEGGTVIADAALIEGLTWAQLGDEPRAQSSVGLTRWRRTSGGCVPQRWEGLCPVCAHRAGRNTGNPTLLCCQGQRWHLEQAAVEVAGERAFDAAASFPGGLAGSG
jgi:hypothetical protein